MSGGYGSGGYPGYDEDPQRTRPRRQGGYDGPAYSDQQYGGQQYDGQQYGDYDGYGTPSHGQGGYEQGGYEQGGYEQGGYDQRGYNQQAAGYDQRRNAGYQQGGYDQRGYEQGGYQQGGQQQGGYENWQQDQRDDSFMPGFGGRGDYDDGYGDRRAPRGGRDGRGPNGPAGRGPDPRGRNDWDDRSRPRKKATRWFPRILILSVVAAIVIGGLVGGLSVYHRYEARYHPADYAGQGTGEVTVQVKSGDTAFSLAPRLLQLGVIASTRAFTNAAENSTSTPSATGANPAGLEAGYYLLHQHMQASLAYAALLNPKNLEQTTVTIVEGKRAVDIIAILAKATKIPLTDFQQVLLHPAQLGLPSYANGKAEGYLFPATYAIAPHETALQILQAMVQRYNVEAQKIGIDTAASTVHLTPAQLITEASLAQSEGGSVSDYPKIAEVINNRLASGMHLQFDSTVLYGLGKYAVSATFKQINTPGPYNTYLNAGLPPGPISSPGDAAIQGVLNAAHGDYLYFLTVPHGKSQFSATPLKGQ
jgi:UPF0755 protein